MVLNNISHLIEKDTTSKDVENYILLIGNCAKKRLDCINPGFFLKKLLQNQTHL
jgi:hypothetical protein